MALHNVPPSLQTLSVQVIASSKSKVKVKVKFTLEQATKAQRYNCTPPLTSALDVVGGQSHAWPALPPVKTRYPLYRRPGEPQSRSGRVRKISPPSGYDPRTVQPVTISATLSQPIIGRSITEKSLQLPRIVNSLARSPNLLTDGRERESFEP
jgi:hypothetical protein